MTHLGSVRNSTIKTNGDVLCDTPVQNRLEMTVEELTMYLTELIENSPIAILVLDPDHRVHMCNPAFERLFQYSQEELLHRNLEDLITENELTAEAIAIWKQVLRGEKVYASTKRKRKDGSIVDVEIHGIPLLIKDRLIGVYGIYHDVSQRKEAEMEVQQLSAQLLKLQDEERRRIARELHDCTAQKFAALNMNLARLREICVTSVPEAESVIADCESLAKESARELRTISYLLHPPTLDDIGLRSAITWYVRGFAERSGIQIDLELSDDIQRLPLDVETMMFRVVQEGLSNIHRHSGSSAATIRLIADVEHIILELVDTGRGMPVNLQGATAAEFGVGIAGMRERVHQLGGRLEIVSNKRGTTLRILQPQPGVAQP
ncbi:MAG TPA: PAS domain-containing sensor histidine kinase [Terriglobales bacterium]|nr:PAS domain-containing sensor histidine kinase [Terriglobales bacterium]